MTVTTDKTNKATEEPEAHEVHVDSSVCDESKLTDLHAELNEARQARLADKHWRAFIRHQSQADHIGDALFMLCQAASEATFFDLRERLEEVFVELLAAADLGAAPEPRDAEPPSLSRKAVRGRRKGHEWVAAELDHQHLHTCWYPSFSPDPPASKGRWNPLDDRARLIDNAIRMRMRRTMLKHQAERTEPWPEDQL